MANIIITLLIVFYRIPLINILGDKGMGYYSIASIVYLLLMSFVAYGLPQALSTIIAEYYTDGHYKLVYKTTKCSFILAVISGSILSLIVFFTADIMSTYIVKAVYSSYAIRAFAPCLLLISILGAFHGIYKGTRLLHVSKTANMIERIAVAVFSIVGAYLFTDIGNSIASSKGDLLLAQAHSSMGAAIGFTGGVFIACIFSLFIFFNYNKKMKRLVIKDKHSEDKSNKEIIKQIIYAVIPLVSTIVIFYLSNLLDCIVFNRIMSVQGHKESSYMILLGMMKGKYEFFISIPVLMVNLYITSKIPVIKKVIHDDNKRKLHFKLGQYVRQSMLYIIPCTAIYILYSTQLMNLIFSGINDTPGILLRVGAISIICYSLAIVSNVTLTALDDWMTVTKNTLLSLLIQFVGLLIMLIIFQWGIIGVVLGRALFALSLCILNEHTLRERTGYIQEQKRTFTIPATAALIMGGISFLIHVLLNLFNAGNFSIIIVLAIAILIYLLSLIFLGGITQREMYRLPGGKLLAPLCKKLHLIK